MERKIAVIGLGMFGASLARSLFERGAEVLAVDMDKTAVQNIADHSSKAVVADATHKETLAELGLEEMDVVVIGLGAPLDRSVLVTLYLRELGVKEIWAKAISDEHGNILKILGAAKVIHPEKDMAERIASTLTTPLMKEHLHLGASYSIIEITCPPAFVDKSMMDLQLRNKFGILIVAVKKPGADEPIMLPSAEHIFRSGDAIVAMGSHASLEKVFGAV